MNFVNITYKKRLKFLPCRTFIINGIFRSTRTMQLSLKLNSFRKIILGMSGGVDSAVAALLLKNKGFEVEAAFMQNWNIQDETGVCSINEDFADASTVCKKLQIKLHHVDFVKEYWNEVFCHLVEEYKSGSTPNPDILCNRNVKFNHFFRYAVKKLGADAIATGHYARTSFGPFLEEYLPDNDVKLLLAEDRIKDQTFFLCQIQQTALRKTMFPLGNLLKSQVKQIARENGLEKVASKPESMGICFIGSRNFQDFISEYITDKPGDFVDADTNEIVGQHKGFHHWTLGQRAKIQGLPFAYFIARKDLKTNIIYVVKGTDHPLMFTQLIFTEKPHWICSQPKELLQSQVLFCDFKFQHTQHWVGCRVFETFSGLIIKLKVPKRAITPGQFAFLAKNGECLGSARICNTAVSDFSLNYFVEQSKLD